MTKQEFLARYKAAQRAERRRLYFVSATAWGFGGAVVYVGIRLARRLEQSLDQQVNLDWTNSLREWVLGAGGLALVVLALAVYFVRESNGVECPCCRKHLQRIGVFLALATGNCSHCGKKVVDDSDGKPVSAPDKGCPVNQSASTREIKMTKPEFIRRSQNGRRKARRYMVTGVAAMGFCMIGAAIAGESKEHGGLGWAGSFDLGKVLLLTGVVIMISCLVVVFVADAGIPCAKCGKWLSGIAAQIAVATDNCGYCGKCAFDEAQGKKTS